MKLIVLTENTTADAAIGCEHGLSLYIETGGKRLLFDMGQTALFAENAQKLCVDLARIDFAVLSHGHYDHGGGLQTFLTCNKTAPVFLSRYAFEPHYNGTEKYIGLDTALQSSERLVFTGETHRIADGLTLLSCNERTRPFDFGSANLHVMQNGVLMPEDFRHEQYLLIEENGRRILISGCSHKGILNIMEWFRPDPERLSDRILHLPLHRHRAIRLYARHDAAAALHIRRNCLKNLITMRKREPKGSRFLMYPIHIKRFVQAKANRLRQPVPSRISNRILFGCG